MSHTEVALEHLTERDQKPVLQAVVAALVAPIDELEAAAQAVKGWRNIDTAEGAVLDQIGRILRERRQGDSDDVYRLRLRVKILVLRSDGLPETLIKVVRAAVNPPEGAIDLHAYPPMSCTITVHTELPAPLWAPLVLTVRRTRAAGVQVSIVLRSAYYPMIWGSVAGPEVGKIYGTVLQAGVGNNFWSVRDT